MTHSEAYSVAMHELHQMYDGPIPGGSKAIEHRARWYMLTRAEQWLSQARVQAMEIRWARQKGWKDREADALARCKHAIEQWRTERRVVQQAEVA